MKSSPVPTAKFLVAASLAALLPACATTQSPSSTRYPNQRQVTQQPAPTPTVPVVTPKTPDAGDDDTQQVQTDPTAPKAPEIIRKDGLTPPHMAAREDIRRVALLLPFSAGNARLREEASSMLKAAELAVFDRAEADTLLIALDTGGTSAGAASAVQSAVKSGSDVILGPLLAGNVRAAGREAAKTRTPVIAFSTDQSVAGNGVYLLSFPPEAEVQRVTEYAAAQGAQSFAFLGPDSTYGKRVNAAYARAAQSVGGAITASESYSGNDISVMTAPAQKLATAYGQAYEQGSTAFDAVLLPEGGTALRSLAPLLTYYEGRTANAQLLGTGLWNRDEIAQEPALRGGIFAGPDLTGKTAFAADYDASFNAQPSRLASLAYDGVNIAADAAPGSAIDSAQMITDPRGFYGVDGFIRFGLDGTPQRGLAIYEVRAGRFDMIDPAPKNADELGTGIY